MSRHKKPVSLRQSGSSISQARSRGETSQISTLALAAITLSVSSPALAQTSQPTTPPAPPAATAAQPVPAVNATQLPALKVEATKQQPRAAKAAPKQTPKSTPAPAPAQASPVVQSQPVAPTAATAQPGSNPYADPDAPYKVDKASGTKLTEPLLDTPRTVTTVSKEVLEDKQATSIRELARTTPGVTLGTGEGGNAFGDVLFIRGFRATSDAYIDGVRDPSVSVRENFMTEQVEVLKGPSATIGGRGTTGGAVNIVTKKPQDQNFGVLSTTVGTDATRRVTADVNQVLDPTLSVRFNGMFQEAEVAGRDFVFDDRWGGAAAATWKPTDSFKLTADYYHLSLDQLPDWGVPWNPIARTPMTETGLRRDTFYGVLDRDFQEGEQDIYTLAAEVKLAPGIVLSSKLRKGTTEFGYVVSAPETTTAQANFILANPNSPELWMLNAAPKSRYQSNEILANQTDVRLEFAAGAVKHTVVAGVELSRESILRDTYRGLDTESFNVANIPGCAVHVFNPDTSGCWDSADRVVRAGAPTKINVITKSAYILDTIKLSPQWIVTGGVRVDDYEIDLDTFNTAGVQTADLHRQDTMINYNGGITWKPAPNGSVYASIGTSTNPVGQEFDAGGDDYGGLTARSAVYAPERNTAIELGTKWELFARKMLVSAALFQTTKSNAREVVGAGPAAQLLDTGEYRVRGIELGVAGNVTSALSLYGGAVFMDSEITKSSVATNIGADFANIAHTTFNLMAKYKLTDRLTIGGAATYAGEIQGGTFAATNGNVLPNHWRFDAMAELEISKNMDLQLNVINLTDELYYDAFYRSGRPYVYVAPGRAAYLTAKFKY